MNQPDLGQLRTRAKELRRAVVRGNPAELARARVHLDGASREDFTLRQAQLVIAREQGHDGWHELVRAVGGTLVAERDLHRWFGVELNNGSWDLIDDGALTPDSPAEDRERALYGAYASTYHWIEAGNAANHARGEYLICAVAAAIGRPDLALHHARRCAELVEANPDVTTDWDAAFAAEGIARALLLLGDPAGPAALERARELAAAVAGEEDRRIVQDRLTSTGTVTPAG